MGPVECGVGGWVGAGGMWGWVGVGAGGLGGGGDARRTMDPHAGGDVSRVVTGLLPMWACAWWRGLQVQGAAGAGGCFARPTRPCAASRSDVVVPLHSPARCAGAAGAWRVKGMAGVLRTVLCLSPLPRPTFVWAPNTAHQPLLLMLMRML